jgi:hypothetical protein
MTEQEKKEQRKKTVKKVWDGSKLIMAIGALTAAIDGYADLSKKSVQLSEQNAALYKALSGKVNDVAERLAFLEGRIDGLNKEAAQRAVHRKLWRKEKEEPVDSDADGAVEVESDEPSEAAHDEPAAMGSPPPPSVTAAPPPQVQIKAYEQLPDNLEALMQEQKQVQQEM